MTSSLASMQQRRGSANVWFSMMVLTLLLVTCDALSPSSTTFLGRRPVWKSTPTFSSSSSLVMYDNSRDPPTEGGKRGGAAANPWTVLSRTERWISSALQNSNNAASALHGNNPYSRKEVSYVCEASSDPAIIVANLFRRLKDARLLGESHGQAEIERAQKLGSLYKHSTLRQTQVLVIPANEQFQNSFVAFNGMIQAVNQARRQARDYVTEAHWDRMDAAEDDDEESKEWSVAVNCAHLHPLYGQKTPKQEIEEMKREDQAGETDVNYQEYLRRHLEARQSPYPTVVIEVRAAPPPDFTSLTSTSSLYGSRSKNDQDSVTAADIMKLEQLFGQQAHFHHPTHHTTRKQEEEAFYSAIGKDKGITELSAMTPLAMAQTYMSSADPSIHSSLAAFTESSTAAVDEAYEFVFTNLAMMAETIQVNKEKQQRGTNSNKTWSDVRHYVVLPRFVTCAATSLEKFAKQCMTILRTLPGIYSQDTIEISTYHPEHVHEARRSPMPILLLQWKSSSSAE